MGRECARDSSEKLQNCPVDKKKKKKQQVRVASLRRMARILICTYERGANARENSQEVNVSFRFLFSHPPLFTLTIRRVFRPCRSRFMSNSRRRRRRRGGGKPH